MKCGLIPYIEYQWFFEMIKTQTSRQKLPEQLFQLRSVTWTIKNNGINMWHTFENTSFRFDKARISWRYGRNERRAAQKEATGVNNPGAANKLTTLAPVFFFQVRATKNVKTEEAAPMFAPSDSTRNRTRKARNACGTNLEKSLWVSVIQENASDLDFPTGRRYF